MLLLLKYYQQLFNVKTLYKYHRKRYNKNIVQHKIKISGKSLIELLAAQK